MNRKNGKSFEDIFYGLLLRVFDEDIHKVEKHFEAYLDQLFKQGVLRPQHCSKSVSRIIQFMPEMALDVPQIHEYLFKFVIRPLITKKQMDLKYIEWVSKKPVKKEDDDDDFSFDTSNNLFLLLAHLLLF